MFHQFRCLFRNGFQAFNEERRDARNELHDSSHRNAQEEYLLDVQLGGGTDEHTYDDTQHQGFAYHAEFLFQPLGVNVQLGEAGYLVQPLIDEHGEGRDALAERLRDGDAVQVIVFLELVRREVGADQCDDVADDGGKIAPCQAFTSYKVGHGTNEGKMPVIPQVDIHRACGLGDEHQQVHTQADGDD